MTEFLLPNNFEQPFIGFSFIVKIYIHTRLLSISSFEKAAPTEFRKWFADYIKIPTDVACFTNDEILPVLEPYIADTITSMIITGIL